MAITKIGKNLLSGAWSAAKAFGRKAMSYGLPALTTTMMANDIASGQSSVGQAIGENMGGLAGFYGAQKLMDAISRRRKIPYLSSLAGFAVPLIGSYYAADKAGNLLNKALPYRRSPIQSSNYLRQQNT